VRLPKWALHTLGFKDVQTDHSFRTLAATRLNSMGFPPDVIELQLSHQEAGRMWPVTRPSVGT
jgi:hypothetical protein